MPSALRSLDEGRELFVKAQQTIRAVVASITRRHQLTSAQTDGLASDAAMKLVADDYLILRKFRGRASLESYLAVVVTRTAMPIAEFSRLGVLDAPALEPSRWHSR